MIEFSYRDTEEFYRNYYDDQVGYGLALYSGHSIMGCEDLGSLLGGVFKKMALAQKNVAGSVAKTMGKNALNVTTDVASGVSFKDAALGGFKRTGGKILGDVFETITGGSGNNNDGRRWARNA